jgi:hypothetical protein
MFGKVPATCAQAFGNARSGAALGEADLGVSVQVAPEGDQVV